MVRSLPAGALLALLVMLFGACDVLDYRPGGQPDASADARLSAVIDLEAAPDTVGLWGTGVALQYEVSSTFGGQIVVRGYLDDTLRAEVPASERILLNLRNVRGGIYPLRVEAVALLGPDGRQNRGERVIGRIERVAIVESGIVHPAKNVQATHGSYLTLSWEPPSSFSVFGYAIHHGPRVDTLRGRLATTWVDSSFTGGNTLYTVEALSRRMKVAATAVQVRSRDVVLAPADVHGTEIRLTWEAPSFTGPLRGFLIERRVPTQAQWAVLDTLRDPSARTFVVANVGLGPSVTYRVRSLGGCLPGAEACTAPPFTSGGSQITAAPGHAVPVLEERAFDPRTRTLLGISHDCGGAASCLVRTAIGGTVPLQRQALPPGVSTFAVAPDGAIYAAAGARVFRLDPETLAPADTVDARVLTRPGLLVGKLAAANDGVLAIQGTERDGHGPTWDIPTVFIASFPEQRLLAAADVQGGHVRISPDGQFVVLGDRIIYERDGSTLRHVRTLWRDDFSEIGQNFALSPDFQHLIESMPDALLLRDFRMYAVQKRLPAAPLLAPHFDPVTGHVGGVTPAGRFHVYRLSDGALLHDLPVTGHFLSYALYDDVLYYGTARCLPLD